MKYAAPGMPLPASCQCRQDFAQVVDVKLDMVLAHSICVAIEKGTGYISIVACSLFLFLIPCGLCQALAQNYGAGEGIS